MDNLIKQLKKDKEDAKELLQEAKVTNAYLEGYKNGLEEAKRIDESLGYALGVLLSLAK